MAGDATTGNALQIFKLGDFELSSGGVLPQAFIAYKTFGSSSNPVIINPTWYTGCIGDAAKLVSEDNLAINPSKYFIIIPALIGNGESISPSNTLSLRDNFPVVTFADNVRAQYRLVTERLGITHIKAVEGWSMGGAQAYQWAVQYPDFMDVVVPICTSAKTAVHNNIMLEGVKSALIAARRGKSLGIGQGQEYPSDEPVWTAEQREAGLKAFARVYAGWGFSQAWYRHHVYTQLAAEDPEDFIVKFWEKWALTNDPDDALVMLRTWQLGDISSSPEFGGDLTKALQSIKAKTLVAPCETDLYFPPEDSQHEVDNMRPGVGVLATIESTWGHWAGGPGDSPEDWKVLDKRMAEAFSEESG